MLSVEKLTLTFKLQGKFNLTFKLQYVFTKYFKITASQ